MLAVVDKAMAVDEAGSVVGKAAHEAVLIESEGEDEKESERDNVGDLDTDETTLEVVADERFFFTVKVVRGVWEGEDESGNEEENLHAKPTTPDQGMRGMFEAFDGAGADELGNGGWFVSASEESVRVEDDDEDDGEAAEAIDLREVATGGGLSLEWGEKSGGPGGHFFFRLWS